MNIIYNITPLMMVGILAILIGGIGLILDLLLVIRNWRNKKRERKGLPQFEHCPPPPPMNYIKPKEVFPIQYISEEIINEVIEMRQIKGRFYADVDTGWVACDNTTGEAWTEDFDTKEMCLKWLNRRFLYGAGETPVGFITEENECEHPFFQCIIEDNEQGVEITCSICSEVILSDRPRYKPKFVSGIAVGAIVNFRKPVGVFYCKEWDAKEKRVIWTGCDNRTGDAWCEEFEREEECIHWLMSDKSRTNDKKEQQ